MRLAQRNRTHDLLNQKGSVPFFQYSACSDGGTSKETATSGAIRCAHCALRGLIVGAELDLQYQLTPRLQGVWSIIPGIPYVITQSLGIRWLFWLLS